MKKAYKKNNFGYMRRTSRVYLMLANKGKIEKLRSFLFNYANIVRYFIEMFWTRQEFTNVFNYEDIKKAVQRFGITARLSSCAYKQAKEIVNSQGQKSKRKRRIPRFRKLVINLDNRFFTLSKFNGSFDWALEFQSGLPKMIIPFSNTKHTLKYLNNGWNLANSIRLGVDNKGLFIDLIFEKEKPSIKQTGEILGVDLGYRVPIATSDKKLLGVELKKTIEKAGKRRKSFHHYIGTEIDRVVKQLDLSNVKLLAIENLKNVKKNKRGKFSRRVNRLLSFWQYARVIQRLRQRCEAEGVLLKVKSSYKTSQRCPLCGNIGRRNRNADRFKCTNCGFEENADIVGAMNLKVLGLAGVYSLRSLKSQFSGGTNVH